MFSELFEKEIGVGILEEQLHDLKDGVFIGIRSKEKPTDFLVVKHRYGDRKWSLPGGGIRQGELPPYAAIREAHEEVNIHITQLRPVGREFTLRKKYGLVILYAAVAWEGLPIIGPDNPEVEQIAFRNIASFTPDEIYPAQLSLLMILEQYWDSPDYLYGYLTIPPQIIKM